MDVMMRLGSFEFGIATAAYQQLTRNIEQRWSESERFGQRASLQYLGPGAETISLPGVIYPEYRGGLGQISAMEQLAGRGELLDMVSGLGEAMGRWVIETIDASNSVFAQAGLPRKIEFTLSLRRAPDAEGTAVSSITPPAAPKNITTAAIPAAASGPVEQVGGLANSLKTAAGGLSASLSNASRLIEEKIAPITDVAREALGAASRSLEVVGELQTMADRTLASVGMRPIASNALNLAQSLASRADQMIARAESASVVMRDASRRIDELSTIDASGRAAMRAAQRAADAANSLARTTAIEAGRIKE